MPSSRLSGQSGVHAVLLVVIVALAGCSSVGGPIPTTPSTQTQSTVHPQPPTTSNDPPLLAPGVSTHGVTDAWILAQAHQSILDNTSFTVLGEQVIRANETVVIRTSARTQNARTDQRYLYTSTATGTNATMVESNPFNVTIFRNETMLVQQTTFQNGTVQYREAPNVMPHRSDPTGFQSIYTLFTSVNMTVDTIVERNGITLYKVVSTGSPHPTSPYANASNFTVTAYVTPTGVVHEYTVTFRRTLQERDVHIRQHVLFVNIGTTDVDPPAWVPNAT